MPNMSSTVIDLAAARRSRASQAQGRQEAQRIGSLDDCTLGIFQVIHDHKTLTATARAAILMTAALSVLREEGDAPDRAERDAMQLMSYVVGRSDAVAAKRTG